MPSRPVVTAAVFLAALALFIDLAPYGCITRDEGWLLDGGARVAAGQLPLRDFDSVYPPTQYLALGQLFAWFGPRVLVERWMWAVGHAAVSAGTWLLASRWMPPMWALLPALTVTVAPGPWHKTPLGLAFVLGLNAYAAAVRSSSATVHLAAGVAMGAAVWLRQDVGLFVLAGGLTAELTLGERPRLARLAAGAAAAVAAPALALAALVGPGPLLHQLIVRAWEAGSVQPAGVAGEAARYGRWAPAVAAVAWTGPALALGTLWSARRRDDRTPEARLLVATALSGVLAANQLLRANLLTRFLQFGVPWHALWTAAAFRARGGWVFGLAAPLGLLFVTLHPRTIIAPEYGGGPALWGRQGTLDVGADPLVCNGEDYDTLTDLASLTRTHVPDGAALVAVPGPPELGFLTGHPNPTRYTRLDGTAPDAIAGLARDLRDGAVPWALVDLSAVQGDTSALREALDACCEVVVTHRAVTLWRARR